MIPPARSHQFGREPQEMSSFMDLIAMMAMVTPPFFFWAREDQSSTSRTSRISFSFSSCDFFFKRGSSPWTPRNSGHPTKPGSFGEAVGTSTATHPGRDRYQPATALLEKYQMRVVHAGPVDSRRLRIDQD